MVGSTADHKPESEIEALMMAKPFEEPEQSSEDIMLLRDVVAEYVDQLDPRDLWVVNACISEGKSLQKIADELGITKTHVWRIRNQAFEKLRKAMMNDTTIRKAVRMADTWEQSAMQWVGWLAGQTRDQTGVYSPDEYRNEINFMLERVQANMQVDERHLQMGLEEIAMSAITDLREREIWDTGEMVATLCRKQHDYGHGNIRKFGFYGVLVRMSDKIERLDNLIKNNRTAANESTNDTLMDIVGYSVIGMMLLDGTFDLELGEDYERTAEH